MPANAFFRFIERLQNKPDKEKTRILFITVAVIMIIIITVWLTLPAENTVKKEQQASPFRAILDAAREGTKEINF